MTREEPGSGLDSTRDLIERIRGGDALAQQRLFERFLPVLRRWASRRLPARTRDLVDTDDIVQLALTRAFRRLESFDPKREGAFLAYLHRILLNSIADEARRNPLRDSIAPLTRDVPDERAELVESVFGAATVERYDAALARLGEEQQHAVILRIEFGLSYVEIAKALGAASPNAVRMQVARALVRLAEAMEAP